MCLSPETAQHVYQAVKNNQPVAPMYIKAQHDIDSHLFNSEDSVETDPNPYEAELTRGRISCFSGSYDFLKGPEFYFVIIFYLSDLYCSFQ